MEESFSIPPEECGDSELDPRIQLELEKLNTATSEINKLELELDESNTTFRMLLNEATRRLKGLAIRLGNSVERARPYHDAATAAADARTACQRAAVQYQRASEIHAAAKETVTLAEQRFQSKQHEWQFDNAWQEMLNHATIKVMDAEKQKAESGREHQKKAQLFNTAETKLQQLEEQLRKHVIKSRAYFEEKQLCQEQLATQKTRIEQLQHDVARAKGRYSRSLRALEDISEDIHRKRRELYSDPDRDQECPVGPREPGVGAERNPSITEFSLELESSDLRARRSPSPEDCGGLEELRRRVRRLAARPLEPGSRGDRSWEDELNSTVQRLDRMLLEREREHDRAQSLHSLCGEQKQEGNPTESIKYSSDSCLDDNLHYGAAIPPDKHDLSSNLNKQLSLSVLALEDLLPSVSKEHYSSLKVNAEWNQVNDDAKFIPIPYKIVDDFNLPPFKATDFGNKGCVSFPDDASKPSADGGNISDLVEEQQPAAETDCPPDDV